MPDNDEKKEEAGLEQPKTESRLRKDNFSPGNNGKTAKGNKFLTVFLLAAILAVAIFWGINYQKRSGEDTSKKTFFGWDMKDDILEETGKMKESKSRNWWLNSGGLAYKKGDILATVQGDMPKDNSWRKLYAKNNPEDTDDGYHPQNIFRLVTRDKWQNLTQQAYFYIDKINLSKSENRNASNGFLLFNRYQDGDNLYYTGLRVDGFAVIKKKIDGDYHTLSDKQLFSGKDYNRENNPNLLPVHTWIGIKSEVKNINDDSVSITLYVDKEGKGNWQQILEVRDIKDKNGDAVFSEAGYAGIRTDFMDVEIKDYYVSELKK